MGGKHTDREEVTPHNSCGRETYRQGRSYFTQFMWEGNMQMGKKLFHTIHVGGKHADGEEVISHKNVN